MNEEALFLRKEIEFDIQHQKEIQAAKDNLEQAKNESRLHFEGKCYKCGRPIDGTEAAKKLRWYQSSCDRKRCQPPDISSYYP